MSTGQNYGASASNTTPNEQAANQSAQTPPTIGSRHFGRDDQESLKSLRDALKEFNEDSPISNDIELMGDMLHVWLKDIVTTDEDTEPGTAVITNVAIQKVWEMTRLMYHVAKVKEISFGIAKNQPAQ